MSPPRRVRRGILFYGWLTVGECRSLPNSIGTRRRSHAAGWTIRLINGDYQVMTTLPSASESSVLFKDCTGT